MDIPFTRTMLADLLRGVADDGDPGDIPTRQATEVLALLADLGVGVPDPVGVSEIADRCGTNRRGVDAWRERQATFPRPRWHIGDRPVWEWSEIVRWGRDTGRVRDGDRWAPLRQPAEATP